MSVRRALIAYAFEDDERLEVLTPRWQIGLFPVLLLALLFLLVLAAPVPG